MLPASSELLCDENETIATSNAVHVFHNVA
jgi:hypothetical protein